MGNVENLLKSGYAKRNLLNYRIWISFHQLHAVIKMGGSDGDKIPF